MATAPRGIGKGDRSMPAGPGRPKGSINKRTQAMLSAAEAAGMLPVDYMLMVMRDNAVPQRERLYAAAQAAPYCHARLQQLQVFTNPDHLDDAALAIQYARLERHVARLPSSADTVTAQIEGVLAGDLAQLPTGQQEAVLRRLLEAAQAGLERLNDRPGKPAPHSASPRASQATPEPEVLPPLRRPGAAPNGSPAPSSGRRMHYDIATGVLVDEG